MLNKLLKILLDPPKTPAAPESEKQAAAPEVKPIVPDALDAFRLLTDTAKRAEYLLALTSRKAAKSIIRELNDVPTLEKILTMSGDSGVIAEARKRLDSLLKADTISTPAQRAYERLDQLVCKAADMVNSPRWFESFAFLDTVKQQWENFSALAAQDARFSDLRTRFDAVCEKLSARVEENRTIAETRKRWDALLHDFANLQVVRGLEDEARHALEQLQIRMNSLPTLPEVFGSKVLENIQTQTERINSEFLKFAEEATRRQELYGALEGLITEIEKLCDVPETRTLKPIQPLIRRFENEVRGAQEFEKELRARVNAAVKKVEARIEEASKAHQAVIKERNDKLTALCEKIEALTAGELTRENMKELAPKIDELVAQFKELRPFADDPLAIRFRKAESAFRDARRTLFNYEDQERWANYSVKVRLTENVEAYVQLLDDTFDYREVAAALKSFREDWKKFGPVPREHNEELWQRFDGACQKIHDYLKPRFEAEDAARADNLDKKRALCQKLEELTANAEISMKDAQAQFEAILAEFKAIGPVPKDDTAATFERYRNAVRAFTEKRQNFYTALRERFDSARKTKEELVSLALKVGDQTWQEGFKVVRDLRQRWKAAGFAGKEHDEKLWNAFNEAITTFFNQAGKDSVENSKIKAEICEKLEKLTAECDESTHLREADEKVKALIEQWRQTGPVAKEETREIVGRFRTALDAWHEKRNVLFAAVNAAKEAAQKQKEDLISQLDDVLNNTELSQNERVEKIKELQTQWRELPLTFRESETQLREEFQNRCNDFFANRRESFRKFMEERNDNLLRKREICTMLESMAQIEAPETDTKKELDMTSVAKELEFFLTHNITAERTTSREDRIERTIELQRQWREIGPVPREENDQLYRRYRRACDAIFNAPRDDDNDDYDGDYEDDYDDDVQDGEEIVDEPAKPAQDKE